MAWFHSLTASRFFAQRPETHLRLLRFGPLNWFANLTIELIGAAKDKNSVTQWISKQAQKMFE